MSNVETKKSSIDKKQELYESSRVELNELSKEIKENEVISPKDVEDFTMVYYEMVDLMIEKAKEAGLNELEEARAKAIVTKFVLDVKAHPNEYLLKPKKEGKKVNIPSKNGVLEQYGNLKYVLNPDAYNKLYNELNRDEREIITKYSILPS